MFLFDSNSKIKCLYKNIYFEYTLCETFLQGLWEIVYHFK